MKLGILIVVLLYEVVTIVGAGIYIYLKRKKSGTVAADGSFALAGRKFGFIQLACTISLSAVGAAHILGIFEMSFMMGAVAIWFGFANCFVIIVASNSTGLWVRKLGTETVPQLLQKMYGKGVAIAIACAMAGMTWGILSLETQGLGVVFSTITGLGIQEACILGGILGILYVVIAGMEEVGIVNVINSAILYIGIIIATILIAVKLPGGTFASIKGVLEGDVSTSFFTSIFGNSELMITFALGTVISTVFCHSVNQSFLQPYMAAKNTKVIKKSVWAASLMNGIFGVFTVTLGLTARGLPEFAALGPKMAATTMIVQYIPSWAAAVLLAALLAAILSTFAMCALTPATLFGVDIYKGLFNKNADEKKVANSIRIALVILALGAMAIATFLPPIIGAINWLFAWVVPVFWLFIFGLFWKRSTKVALCTLIITWALNCIWSFTGLPAAMGGIFASLPNGYLTLIVGFIVSLVGNLAVKGEPGYFKTIAAAKNTVPQDTALAEN